MKRIMIICAIVLFWLAFAFGLYSRVITASASPYFGSDAIGVDAHAAGGTTYGTNVVGVDRALNSLSGPADRNGDMGWRPPVFETYGLHGNYQRNAR